MDKNLLTVIKTISGILINKNLRLSIAESCTGGYVSNALTDIPGVSKFFSLSVISYSAEAKASVLGISRSLLKKHGTVSEETAIEMAKAVRKLASSDLSLSITGVAGPSKTEGKGVGLVYFAVAAHNIVESKGMKFSGTRTSIKKQAALEALKFLHQVLRVWI